MAKILHSTSSDGSVDMVDDSDAVAAEDDAREGDPIPEDNPREYDTECADGVMVRGRMAPLLPMSKRERMPGVPGAGPIEGLAGWLWWRARGLNRGGGSMLSTVFSGIEPLLLIEMGTDSRPECCCERRLPVVVDDEDAVEDGGA